MLRYLLGQPHQNNFYYFGVVADPRVQDCFLHFLFSKNIYHSILHPL